MVCVLMLVCLQNSGATMDVVRILLAIILPPLGVFLQVGIGLHFWLNILLTLCGYVPGIIHAIWVILRK
ncbi:proteolipid membrane potential modulator protein (plasmid) [Rhizobium etli bv. mimosae str. IE4771]|uniref:Proteolipid membrane potential modulator protein n=9 Tax=Rhizobium TaxID=379 RepID=A0A060I5M9_RHIET|nr:proteolipid membrane potential modulator protein [Rhizobium sp. IE4771]